MKQFKEKLIVGIDHGYGNIKTANHCFKTGIMGYDAEPLFTKDMLEYGGRYYLIGEGHKEFLPDKIKDEDYYLLTLVAIAEELKDKGLTEANVIIAAGLPLTWTSGQKNEFAAYLSKNEEVSFTYQHTDYHIRISGVKIYPQGYAAVAEFVTTMKGLSVVSPLIVRPKENTTDEYEVVSGHRRLHAAVKAGLETVPAFIYALDRDTAAIAVVDSNLHREHILPSEKAFAYKMKADALSHQGQRSDLTSGQFVPKSDSNRTTAVIGESLGESYKTVQRYIRLTHLIPELLDWMDEGKMALSVGVELSFLSEEAQYGVLEECELYDCTPSYSQAFRMKNLYNDGQLSRYEISKMLSQAKPNQRETLKIPMDKLRDRLPQNLSVSQQKDFILKAVDYYKRFLQRQRDRDSR